MTTSVSRRSLAKGAVWALPAISVTAASPAFAASGCLPVGITFPTTTTSSASITGTSSAGVTATATNKVSGSVTTSAGYNMTSNALQGTTAVQLAQNPTQGSYQELTFTFSQPVYNLQFQIFDVDYNTYNTYTDYLVLTAVNGATPPSFTSTTGSFAQGSGTAASPWQPNKTANKTGPVVETDPRTTVAVSLAPAAAVTSFTIRFYSPTKPQALQQIWVGGISFTTNKCPVS